MCGKFQKLTVLTGAFIERLQRIDSLAENTVLSLGHLKGTTPAEWSARLQEAGVELKSYVKLRKNVDAAQTYECAAWMKNSQSGQRIVEIPFKGSRVFNEAE